MRLIDDTDGQLIYATFLKPQFENPEQEYA